MASDTVPAVPPPPPHDPAVGPVGTGMTNLPGGPAQPAGQAGGWLGGLLTAVDPARPTFDLNPTTLPADGQTDGAVLLPQGGSSADFHGQDGDTGTNSGGQNTNGSQEKGILRAWLLAGAERWRKGADARNKRLDIQKEHAKALQVKESRTVNRSEKIVGGNTGTSNYASKGSDTKTSAAKKDHASGSKSNGSGGTGGSRSGAGGRSGTSGHGSGGRHGSAGSGTSGGRGSHGSGGTFGKDGAKTDHSKSGGTKSAGSGSGGGAGKAGKDGAPGKAGKDTKASPSNGTDGKTPKQTTSTCGDASGISTVKDKKPEKAKAADATPGGGTAGGGKNTPPGPARKGAGGAAGGAGGAGANTGSGKTPAPSSGNKPVDLGKKNPDTKGGDKTTPKTATGPSGPDLKKTPATPDPKTTPTPGPAEGATSINTQSSREAGYRDGARAGKVAAHVDAYKDGVKDGWTDARQAAARDKDRLDKARQQRTQTTAPQTPPAPAPIPPKPTVPPKPSVPPAPDPRTILMKPKETPVATPASATPIKVDGIDKSNLRLGDGAARTTIGRGEVRRLKDFERVFTTKADNMTRLGDATKTIQANAEERTKGVTYLMEEARALEGGEDLVADLTRLREATQAQIGRAGELHKRTVRGADNTRTLLANVETRYGGMYQAVVDSPLTQHAESSYYRK